MKLQKEEQFCREFEQKVAAGLRDAVGVGVALSGGADSVALLLAISRNLSSNPEARVFGLHCNFGLRGDESDGDEDFCRDLCRCTGVGFRAVRFDVASESRPHESLEMACRRLRYDWFERQAAELGLDAVAIAHHREDAVETAFINMLRGTGPRGMRGMDAQRGIYLRPMLDLARRDIERYLAANGIGFRIDSSNLTDDYRRNALRNTILPAIRQAFPASDAGIAVTMDAMRSSGALIDEYIGILVEACSTTSPELSLDVSAMARRTAEPAAALFLAVPKLFGCRLTLETAADCVRAAESGSGSRLFEASDGSVLELFGGRLMHFQATGDDMMPLAEAVGRIVSMEILNSDEVDIHNDREAGLRNAYFDAALLDSGRELRLRRWRDGDRMRPFGMKGTRKVSDIFSDLHLSASRKNSLWLLTASDGDVEEVLWIAGVRSSALYPVKADCGRVVRIVLL